ncbi:lytic transglycosylase, partial [Escherichia coli]|nr:lytic transglycosylase [Escherichia coli]
MHTLRNYLILLLVIPFFSVASTQPIDVNLSHCFNQASERFQIDHRLLIAIAQVESGMNSKAIG